MRPAVPTDACQLPPSDEVVGHPEPLLGPGHVVDSFTGVEHRAENALDDGQVRHVTTARRGETLVELDHALHDQAGEHEHDTEPAARLTLQIGIPVALGQLNHGPVQTALSV